MCGGGGSAPQDNSDKVAAIEAQTARENAARDEAQRRQQREEFDGRLSSSYQSAINDARQYFSSMGLDPDQYMGAISQQANSNKGMVPTLDGSPGTYFQGMGNTVYDNLQTGERSKAGRELDQFAGAGFDRRLIDNYAADPTVQAILAEQEQERRNYADNLKARGVVTDTGYQSALDSIGKQKFGVQSGLSEIAKAVLEGGRGDLRNIASDGRGAASQVNLGQQFNAQDYAQQINNTATDFLQNLGGNVRSRVGDNMFDLSSILRTAGAGQGAQNTAFDPAAFFGTNIGEPVKPKDDPYNSGIPQPMF